jgi:hypothetical protein
MTPQQENTLGKTAYAAYCEAVGGQTHDGQPTPAWENLGPRIQNGWRAAAQAATDVFVNQFDDEDFAYYPTDLALTALDRDEEL